MAIAKQRLTTLVSQADKVQHAIAEVVKDFGTIDVFVANAGMARLSE